MTPLLVHFICFFLFKNHDNSRDTHFKKTSIYKKSLKIATQVYLYFNGDFFYLIGHDHLSSQYINKEHTLKKNCKHKLGKLELSLTAETALVIPGSF